MKKNGVFRFFLLPWGWHLCSQGTSISPFFPAFLSSIRHKNAHIIPQRRRNPSLYRIFALTLRNKQQLKTNSRWRYTKQHLRMMMPFRLSKTRWQPVLPTYHSMPRRTAWKPSALMPLRRTHQPTACTNAWASNTGAGSTSMLKTPDGPTSISLISDKFVKQIDKIDNDNERNKFPCPIRLQHHWTIHPWQQGYRWILHEGIRLHHWVGRRPTQCGDDVGQYAHHTLPTRSFRADGLAEVLVSRRLQWHCGTGIRRADFRWCGQRISECHRPWGGIRPSSHHGAMGTAHLLCVHFLPIFIIFSLRTGTFKVENSGLLPSLFPCFLSFSCPNCSDFGAKRQDIFL